MQSCEPDWAGLHSPLLQSVLLLALGSPTVLQYAGYLLRGVAGEAGVRARQQQAALSAFSLVCRRWREAAQAALQQPCLRWAVTLQCSPAAAADLPEKLEQLTVAELDVRRLTWSEGSGAALVHAALGSPAFQRRSGPALRSALGVPERLAPILAAAAGSLECAGLAEDYASTLAHTWHLAPMCLVPLAHLPHLRRLQLELGIVELAAVPPQVLELQLVEVDRLVLPPAAGASVADRLLAAAEAHGLRRLSLEAVSGCVVFEEAHKAPMELELSHVARLLAGHAARWQVQLSVRADAAVQQRRPCLDLLRLQA